MCRPYIDTNNLNERPVVIMTPHGRCKTPVVFSISDNLQFFLWPPVLLHLSSCVDVHINFLWKSGKIVELWPLITKKIINYIGYIKFVTVGMYIKFVTVGMYIKFVTGNVHQVCDCGNVHQVCDCGNADWIFIVCLSWLNQNSKYRHLTYPDSRANQSLIWPNWE